jgi:thymidylate synthase
MKQYHKLLKQILADGTWKDPARKNLPRTLSIFGTRMEFNMADGFPILTTKKIFYKACIAETLWFLKGYTNIKFLVDNGCNIWNKDAYRWYLKKCENNKYSLPMGFEAFIACIKASPVREVFTGYKLGDLGKVYGYQWRNQNGVDQIKKAFDSITNNPESRYHIWDAWNMADFPEMALPPCHLLYQFNCRKVKSLEDTREQYALDLIMFQRSCDTFLGVPFDLVLGGLILHIFAKAHKMIPGKFVWLGGDTHLYENHLDQTRLQLNRPFLKLPKLKIHKELNSFEDIIALEPSDIEILKYESHAKIEATLSVGLPNETAD